GGVVVGSGGRGGARCPGVPPPNPMRTSPVCSGSFSCSYNETCRCGTCCVSQYMCLNGQLKFLIVGDSCYMVTCDAGTGIDGPHAVCTPGADRTCNDNPIISSIHGHCTDAGVCECGTFGTNPDSGRCL